MQLTVWTYEGPPHVGAMRVCAAMKNVHYVLHAPQGDTYADLLFTMIERRDTRPPVTYTTFQARDLGGDTAELFKNAAHEAYQRFKPEALVVGSSCTAELIQDDPGGLAQALGLPVPVIPLELPAYQRKENWGAAETFYRIVRTLAGPHAPPPGVKRERAEGARPKCNILGPTTLGFRHRDDLAEILNLVGALGIEVNVVAPLGATPADIARIGDADFNIVLYPEVAGLAASWLLRTFGQKSTRSIPIGVGGTRDFIAEVASLAGIEIPAALDARARLPSATPLHGSRGGADRSIRPISPASACSFSAMRRMPLALRVWLLVNLVSKLSALVLTAANLRARFARQPRFMMSSPSSATIILKSRWPLRLLRPNSCSARKWSGILPSACVCPAR
jgi:light-independent protochlorophyllide reductase subunit B